MIAIPIVLSSAAGATQTPASASTTYRELVSDYRGADADSVRRLTALPPTFVESATNEVLSAEPASRWTADDLRAAGMLHTDAGIELMKQGLVQQGIDQINIAARFIDAAVEALPAHASYGSRWYAFAVATLHIYSPPWSKEFDERAQARFRKSPGERALWISRQQELLERTRPRLHEGPPIQRNLETAFEDVLHLDPESYEAWLHLGRLRMRARDQRPAIEALQMATRSPERRVRYLAHMFLGSIAERSGDYGEAERRYRAAADAYPWAQSAPLALAHLLSRTAREAEARDLVASQLTRARGLVVDPHWTYFVAPDELLDATLKELRVEVMRW